MSFIYLNGNFYEDTEAKISVKDRGFRFGDGVFETISFYDGNIFRWDLHKARLEGGLNALKIEFNTERLEYDILRTIEKNSLMTGFARVAISRGEGSQGYLPTYQKPYNLVIEVMERPNMEREYANLIVSKYRKIPKECLPVHFKISQGLNSTLAKMEARELNYFEALQLNVDDEIAECASGNIFWVIGKTIYTPSLECSVLNGVMRQVIIEKSPYRIVQGRFKLKHIKKADEVFITNVSIRLLAVNEIKDVWKSKGDLMFTKKMKDIIK
jgi:branched-chain amino acid aminotransferase